MAAIFSELDTQSRVGQGRLATRTQKNQALLLNSSYSSLFRQFFEASPSNTAISSSPRFVPWEPHCHAQ